MAKARLSIVTLGVSVLARSARFYQDLGFARRFRAAGEEVAFFDAGGMILALYGWDALAEDAQLPGAAPQPFRGFTLSQLCRTDRDVDALMTRALGAGATLLKHPQRTFFGGYSGYFADPDGHAWEVVRAPGFQFAADGRVSLPE